MPACLQYVKLQFFIYSPKVLYVSFLKYLLKILSAVSMSLSGVSSHAFLYTNLFIMKIVHRVQVKRKQIQTEKKVYWRSVFS